jgi:DNA-binding XRE family transcriptional regulator
MAKSVIEDMVDHKGFSVKVTPFHGNDFLVSTMKEDDAKLLFALILRRNREKANLTMKEVAEKMGASSVTSYARYEQGKTQPSIEKLFEILRAIDKESEPVLTLLIS